MNQTNINDAILHMYVTVRMARDAVMRRIIPDEAGEGVISAAIAVLIMAALGAVMWIGFQELWGKASSQTDTKLDAIAS